MKSKTALMYATAKSLRPGDIIMFRCVMLRPASDEIKTALITEVETKENGTVCITYIPCNRPDSVQCGFGCHFFAEYDTQNVPGKWGWQNLLVVGTGKRPGRASTWYPQPGNTGYDLMC